MSCQFQVSILLQCLNCRQIVFARHICHQVNSKYRYCVCVGVKVANKDQDEATFRV